MLLRTLSENLIEPVSVTEAKEHLRISFSEDDNYLGSLISKVREFVELYLNTSLVNRQLEIIMDDIPDDGFQLPFPPVVSIDAMQYGFDEDDERIDIGYKYSHSSNKIYFNNGITKLDTPIDAFRCVFTVGSNETPKRIKQAILMLIGHWYENREEVLTNVNFIRLPYGAKMLLDQERGFKL